VAVSKRRPKVLTKISGMLADVVIGLLVAGVIVAVLVPALGTVVGPAIALGVAGVSVAGALTVGYALRRSKNEGG
jgi:Mg2+/Co2+ transporter CorB